MNIRLFSFLVIIAWFSGSCNAQTPVTSGSDVKSAQAVGIITGAMQYKEFIPGLKSRKVAVAANQTSMIGNRHLVDVLLENRVEVLKVFAPEHGFRGEAGPGDHVSSGTDTRTGLPVVSLYGSKKRPAKEDLQELDIVIFDMQDVGARFYTFISTLHYLMEACAENNLELWVLDRPNPNGNVVDGPMLSQSFTSFVGVAPVPVAHGLTMGEYAGMANGEGWLGDQHRCKLKVITMQNYSHHSEYVLPVRPSPNLPDMESVYLYPSLCLFEGTAVSVGRGTNKPFRIIGYPGFDKGTFNFTPEEIPGVIKDPPYEGRMCSGIDLTDAAVKTRDSGRLNISWLIELYESYPDKDKFFNNFFDKLAGTDQLRIQIIKGIPESAIRNSWEPALSDFKSLRKKYLLYPE